MRELCGKQSAGPKRQHERLLHVVLRRRRFQKAIVGSRMISLKTPVPYTTSTKPITCSHLKDSQPSPSDTAQMANVRQASSVLRAAAE